eukprot:285438-Chlamydomonas_euryale.AAC.4
MRSFLAEVLNLKGFRFEARDAIKLDYASYVLEFSHNLNLPLNALRSAFRFAKEQKYGPIRTSSLFDIAQKMLQVCIGAFRGACNQCKPKCCQQTLSVEVWCTQTGLSCMHACMHAYMESHPGACQALFRACIGHIGETSMHSPHLLLSRNPDNVIMHQAAIKQT